MTRNDIIKSRADKFCKIFLRRGLMMHGTRKTTRELRVYLDELLSNKDKVLFLENVKKTIREAIEKHKITCKGCILEERTSDFIFNIDQEESLIYQDSEKLSNEQHHDLVMLIDDLEIRVSSLAESQEISLELIGILKNEIQELKWDFESLNKKQAKRAFYGVLFKVFESLASNENKGSSFLESLNSLRIEIEKIFDTSRNLLTD